MIETSSGRPRKFSAIFGNVRERLRNNFGKSSESGRKTSQNRQKHRHQYVLPVNRTFTRLLEDMNFMFE